MMLAFLIPTNDTSIAILTITITTITITTTTNNNNNNNKNNNQIDFPTERFLLYNLSRTRPECAILSPDEKSDTTQD